MPGPQLKFAVKLKFPSPRGVVAASAATHAAAASHSAASASPRSSPGTLTQTLHRSPYSAIIAGTRASSSAVRAAPTAHRTRVTPSSSSERHPWSTPSPASAVSADEQLRNSPKGFVTMRHDCTS